jgi:DNA-binding transcriptional regulator GbsR (MarR family)
MERVMPSVEREFAGRMALFFESLGATATMGLIYGWLTVCEPEHQSITQMAHALGVSKASISTVVRQLEQAQMVERVPLHGTRQHHYQIRTGGWAQILRARMGRLRPGVAAADYGLANIGADRPEQRARLEEMRDFFDFVEADLGDELVRRWEKHRKQTRDAKRRAEVARSAVRPSVRPGRTEHRMPAAVAAARRTDSDPPR